MCVAGAVVLARAPPPPVPPGRPAFRALAVLGPADIGPADTGPADTGPANTGPADTGPAETGPCRPRGRASRPGPASPGAGRGLGQAGWDCEGRLATLPSDADGRGGGGGVRVGRLQRR